MPKQQGYEPSRDAGLSSNRTAFPVNREPKGTLRSGPAPYPERPPVKNIHNVDPKGHAQPWKGSR